MRILKAATGAIELKAAPEYLQSRNGESAVMTTYNTREAGR